MGFFKGHFVLTKHESIDQKMVTHRSVRGPIPSILKALLMM